MSKIHKTWNQKSQNKYLAHKIADFVLLLLFFKIKSAKVFFYERRHWVARKKLNKIILWNIVRKCKLVKISGTHRVPSSKN